MRTNKNFTKRIAAQALAITAGLVLLTACSQQKESTKTIKVAASATPHAESLEQAKSTLATKGYTLEVTVFDDYVQPNNVVESDEFQANYVEHVPYLNSFNEEKGTHLVNAGGVHYEPFGLYGGTKKSLDDLADGDTIAIPFRADSTQEFL